MMAITTNNSINVKRSDDDATSKPTPSQARARKQKLGGRNAVTVRSTTERGRIHGQRCVRGRGIRAPDPRGRNPQSVRSAQPRRNKIHTLNEATRPGMSAGKAGSKEVASTGEESPSSSVPESARSPSLQKVAWSMSLDRNGQIRPPSGHAGPQGGGWRSRRWHDDSLGRAGGGGDCWDAER